MKQEIGSSFWGDDPWWYLVLEFLIKGALISLAAYLYQHVNWTCLWR